MVLLCLTSLAPAQVNGPLEGSVGELPSQPLPPNRGPFGAIAERVDTFRDRALITSKDMIRTEDDVAYAGGRTKVEYNQFSIEADRMVIDFIAEEVTAEGNVVFKGPDEFIQASGGRFNLSTGEGVAFGVNGQVKDYFFRAQPKREGEKGPSFRQINEQESIFRGAQFTTCDFPVPHYYVEASEVILIRKERVYFRNPVLYVQGVPVLWLPFYTRNLEEGSPWSQQFGYNSRIGAFLRVGYRYIHRVKTPSFEDPTRYETRSHGLADVYTDIMGQRGLGVGVQYRYQFDYKRHLGYLEVYGIRDEARDVAEEELRDRWVYRHKHNSLIGDTGMVQLDADEASDSDVYIDILDRFQQDPRLERGRLFELRTRVAASMLHEAYVVRLLAEQRDRLGRDRYTDFADPFSDDLDLDPDPDFTDNREYDDEGISNKRFGTTTERAQLRWGTRLLKLGAAPLYYRFEANAFNALDAGFNQVRDDDDARTYGVDLYNSLTNRVQLGRRTTWTNTVGVGAALYDREQEEIVSERDFRNGAVRPDGSIAVDDQRFVNRDTLFLGDSDTRVSTSDTDAYYLFADYASRLNHRFADFLDGYIQYKVRRGTGDTIGEFYEQVGRTEAAGDVYDFYTDQHVVEGGINYFLRYPNFSSSLVAGQNLDSGGDIYANERLNYAALNNRYANPTGEFTTDFGVGYQTRQIRDRDDPNAYEQGSFGPYVRLRYYPRHSRYWAELNASSSIKTEDDPVNRDVRQRRRYDEDEAETVFTPVLGRRFGPKYRVQVSGTYNSKYEDWTRAGVTVIRDLHDAELGLFAGVRNNTFEARRGEDDRDDNDATRQVEYEYEVRASLKFKIQRDQPGLGQRSITTLSDVRREAQFVQ